MASANRRSTLWMGVGAGLRGGAIAGGLQGAASSPDLTDLLQTAKDTGLGALAGGIWPKVIAELLRLVSRAKNEATRVAACKELLDRAIGKAVQPHSGESGEGPVIIEVITGAPRHTVE